MPDYGGALGNNLGELGLSPQREEEILRELGEHLEDSASEIEARGVAREEAIQQALDSVSDWPALRAEILSAEAEEGDMNYRTKVFWLPALGALALSNGLLAFIEMLGPSPHFHWLSSRLGMEPYLVFFVPWLIAQPVVGAVAAYWSRGAGGVLGHQIGVALAPAIALFGVFVFVIPVSIIIPLILGKHLGGHFSFTGFALMTLVWVLVPSIGLFIGAAPFLRKPHPQA